MLFERLYIGLMRPKFFRPFLAEGLEDEVRGIIASLVQNARKLLVMKALSGLHDVFEVLVCNLNSNIVAVSIDFQGFATPTQNVLGCPRKRFLVNGKTRVLHFF